MPHPSVLELGAVGIHAPAAHLDAGIHVAIQHQARSAARAAQAPDRLARRLARLGPVRDVHHLDVEANVRHVVRKVIGERALLERRARNADRRLLEREHLRVGDARENLGALGGVRHRRRS